MLGADNGLDILDWISRGGLLAGTLVALWAFLNGKIHGDKEFQREMDRCTKLEERLDRVLSVQENTTPIVKEAIKKRAEITDLGDLAALVDFARENGLLEK